MVQFALTDMLWQSVCSNRDLIARAESLDSRPLLQSGCYCLTGRDCLGLRRCPCPMGKSQPRDKIVVAREGAQVSEKWISGGRSMPFGD
jgi:hypothetical protein